MEHQDYIAALRWNAAAAAHAVRETPLDTTVPSCPEWKLRDLVRHLGSHHRWVAGNLDCPPEGEMFKQREPPPEDATAADWLETGAELLATKLTALDPATPCWTWVPFDRSVGFWARRTAHETAVHRWDTQHAGGIEDAIDPELAVDGIDEYLGLLPAFPGRRFPESGSIHLHATDTPGAATAALPTGAAEPELATAPKGEWVVRLDAEGMHVSREHAKGDVALRGPASDVLLVLFGRKTIDTIDVFGDAPLFERFREQARF